ncbi:hypothetical protein [Arthrobacter sp. efr-133-TYG-118]|uniref:hypothetical protein n=1 Tax=Arthrobacter sp. efr-133-TYG-118 TaxID=3040279 RepID=UPI00254B815A|nr:hypothetical protein [Arthrobacter sp. efr-133-TYG-118]
MAKSSYRITTPLNRGYLDHEISFPIFGWQIPATPLKQLVFLGGGMLVVVWAAMTTFIKDANPGLIALFVIWGFIAVFYLGGLTKTRELRFRTVPAFLAYAPKRARHVVTRRNADPSEFYSIVGIDDVTDDGEIRYADRSVGQIYLVVGSASYLLFDEDRVAILDRVDSFWRKVQTTCEYDFITTKEPQRIYHQLANLERRNQALEIRDPHLLELQNEQHDILTEHVGGKFSSIHQYVLLKGKSSEALRQAHLILQAEVEQSSLMVKEATVLDREESYQMLRVFYQGVDGA